MSEHIYKVVEVIGSSAESWAKAAEMAIKNASASLEDLRVAKVVEQDIRIGEDGKVLYRSKLDLSFRLHDKSELQK
jgi:flavin-binding protein dodecin